MAIFGAPLPLPEPAFSAVAAALEMVEMLGQFSAERAASRKAPIRIGIGIATGEMVAGYTGTEQRATYTCIGDTVNVAARLEAHTKAARRTILIDVDTHAALAGRLHAEPLGAVPFRGKRASVEVWSASSGGR